MTFFKSGILYSLLLIYLTTFSVSCSSIREGRNYVPTRYVVASRIGLIPNNVSAAKDNANQVAKYVNNGYGVTIDNTYYIGKSDVNIEKSFVLKGKRNGQLIMTNRLSWTIVRPISICLSELSLRTILPISPSSQIRLIENNGCNYHPSVIIESCKIDGIRVYSHVALDVDQVHNKDGVKSFTFKNNVVTNTGYYVVRLTNCLCENASILDNVITDFKSIVFGLNLTNGLQDLGFCRMKSVHFSGNKINNAGFILDDSIDYDFLYHTPITVEAESCECTNNIIENILCTQDKPIAVYPFYLSSTSVVISNNRITNCLNLSDSSNNELFKCKQVLNGPAERLIENNICIITKECLAKTRKKGIPYVKMCGFQTPSIKSAIFRNNSIDVACDFVFGAPVKSEYGFFEFSENKIIYNDIGLSSRQMLRLLPSSTGKGRITIYNNCIKSRVVPSSLYALFDYDYSGYLIDVHDNELSGALPYGSISGTLYSPTSITCYRNTINIGVFNSLIKIPTYVKTDDMIEGGDTGYSIRLMGNPQEADHIMLDFSSCTPASISFQNASEKNTNVHIVSFEKNGDGTKKIYKYNGVKYTPSKKAKRILIEVAK